MITEIKFKGLNALKIENDKLRVIVVPDLGGKIASLVKKDKNFELFFQHKNEFFSEPVLYDDFAEFDASGFDDCFPSVDSSIVNVNGGEIKYPDHGEIWSKSMNYEISDNVLKLECDSEILPYTYEKKISIDGDSVSIDYRIVNTGTYGFPYIWTMHGLVKCEEDIKIFFPAGTKEIINVQSSEVFGKPGALHTFPDTTLSSGEIYSLDRVESPDAGETKKFYVNSVLSEGKCGVYYPSKDVHYTVYFDKEKVPYLGLWITEGGFRGDYNLALEPSNGFYDSIDIAAKNRKLNYLQPGDKLEFKIEIEISDGKYNK